MLMAARRAIALAPALLESEAGEDRLRLRRLSGPSTAELRETAAVLAHAFDDGPLARAALPHPAARSKSLRTLFGAALKDAVRFGRVEIAYNGKIVGAAVWYRSDRYPMPLARLLRLVPDYARVALTCPGGLFALWRAQRVLHRLLPKEPHCHLVFVGGRQGEQVGGALMQRLLEDADAEGLPIYLETQVSRLTELYGRFGFKVLTEGIETLPGGPATWTMWREPRARWGASPIRSYRRN